MSERKLCYGCMEMKPAWETVCPHCGYAEGTDYDTNYMAPGTVLGERYAVGVLLGHNSEGATYIGYNNSIGCKVLIREYMPEGMCTRVKGRATISVNPSQVVQYKALMAEFTELNKTLARLRNTPHIRPTQDLFSMNNTTYAVYEYLEGYKLVDYLKENAGDLPWKRVSEMFPPFFTSLSLMHNSGILHRAISPDTIYVSDKGELRLCGFSISTVRTKNTELPCEIFGGYAAPEQYSPSAQQGTWTDVYAICATLYRILTGCKPTDAPSRLQNDNLCPPHEMNPGIPRHVSSAIMRGMSLFAGDRIQTVTELVTVLFEQHGEESHLTASVPPPASHTYQFSRKEAEEYRRREAEEHRRRQAEEERMRRQESYDDYVVDAGESVIDRIKIPIIIGVLLTCVLLVIAVIALNLLDMGPFNSSNSSRPKETSATTETVNNVVTETVGETETETRAGDSTMPNLIGKDYNTLKELRESDKWFTLDAEFAYNDEYANGQIFYQEIEPGDTFASGSTIKVKVSKGPSSIVLPSYDGYYLRDYEALLEEMGLTNYQTEAVVNYRYDSGMVVELSKPAGEKFDMTGKETLKIYYASNPETNPPETDPPTEPETDPPAEPETDPPAEPEPEPVEGGEEDVE